MNRSLSSEPAFDPSVFINHRSMMAPKKSRKQVEDDAKALSNRLSLLQKEESKIWKNLELAKTKAYELYLVKKRDAERNKDKQMKNEESFMGSQGRQLNSMLIRKRREETIFNLKEALQRQKHKEMLIVKRQSEMMRVRKQDFEDRFLVENRNKMLTVKKQELLSNFKKKAFFEDKLLRVKQDQQKRLDEEEDFKVMKELEVLNMEKAEMEMVQRIHKAKDLQKQVYKNLESMLTFNENGDVVDNREYRPTQLSARESEPVLGSIRMRSLNGSVLGEEQDSTQRLQVVEKMRSRSVRRLSFR